MGSPVKHPEAVIISQLINICIFIHGVCAHDAQAWKGDPNDLARVVTVDAISMWTLPLEVPSLNHHTRRAQVTTALQDPQMQFFALACLRVDPRLQFKKSTIYMALKLVAAAHATCIAQSYVTKWLLLEVPRVHLALKGIRAALRESADLPEEFVARLPANFKDAGHKRRRRRRGAGTCG